jgi:serine/threonine protein kinase
MNGGPLGAHSRARGRWFRKFIDQHDEMMDESTFSALQSVAELQREMVRLDKTRGLMGLAHTGKFVELLVHFNTVLDSAVVCSQVPLPEGLTEWKLELESEREARVDAFNAAWSDRAWVEAALPSEVDYERQLELMTTIKAGFSTYSRLADLKDTQLLEREEQLIIDVYTDLFERWGLVVVTIPDWFVSESTALSKYVGVSARPVSDCKQDIVRTAATWWDLHHPHIMRLMGVCHVSDPPLVVHESAQSLSEYIREHSGRTSVWFRLLLLARGLHYLHQRGFICRDITPDECYCAGVEGKAMLSGESVVALKDKTVMESNINRFGLCVLAFLYQASKASEGSNGHWSKHHWARLPSHRLQWVSAAEWEFITKMCQPNPIDLVLVIQEMTSFASVLGAVNRIDEVTLSPDEVNELFLPRFGSSLANALVELDHATMRLDSHKRAIYTRCCEVHQHLLLSRQKRCIAMELGDLLWKIMLSLEPAQSCVFSDDEGSCRQGNTTLHFHLGIDRLFGLLNVETHLINSWRTGYQTWLENEAAETEPNHRDEDELEDAVLTAFEAKQLGVCGQTAKSHFIPLDSRAGKAVVLPRWFIPHYEVTTSEFIAQGSFGSVYRGKWFDTDVVVKELFLLEGQDIQKKRLEFLHEADTWFQLNHVNIVKMYGGCHVGRFMFVCESAPGGSLPDYLRERGRDPNIIWKCLIHAATGIRYLHGMGVVHGDLKGNNIVVGEGGVAKLTDFGLSFFRRDAANAEHGAIGAFRWKAPECLRGKVATFASDVFSFGMCIIEAVSGLLPWSTLSDDCLVKYYVIRGNLPERPDQFDDDAWDLVMSMCSFEPSARPTMATVMVRLAVIMERRELRRFCLSQSVRELEKQPSRVCTQAGGLDTLLLLVKSGLATRLNGAKLALQHFAALVRSQGGGISDCDAVELHALLKSDSREVQTWAAVALGYCACPIQETARDVIWVLTSHVNLADVRAHSGAFLLREEAVRALGILARDNVGCRIAITSPRTIRALVKLIQSGTVEEKSTAARTIGYLAAGREDELMEFDDFALTKALIVLAQDQGFVSQRDGAWALRRLVNFSEARRQWVDSIAPDLLKDVNAQRQRLHQSVSMVLNEMLDRTPEHWGSIASLVELSLEGTGQDCLEAKLVLSTRARKPDNFLSHNSLLGTLHLLIRLVQCGDDNEKVEASSQLERLARGKESCSAAIISVGGISPLATLACDGTREQRLEAIKTLRQLSLEDSKGVILAVVAVLRRDKCRREQANAVEALGQLVFRNYANQMSAVRGECVPALISFVKNSSNSEKTLSVRTLGHLADGNDKARAVVVCQGAIEPILHLLRHGSDGQKDVAVRTLESLAIDEDDAQIREEMLPVLMGIARDSPNPDVTQDALQAIDFLADASITYRATLLDQGGISLLVDLALTRADRSRDIALQVLKRLVDSDDDMIREVLAPIIAALRGNEVNRRKSTERDAIQTSTDRARLQVLTALVRWGSHTLRRLGARLLCRLWSHSNKEQSAKNATCERDATTKESSSRQTNAVLALRQLACCNPNVEAAIVPLQLFRMREREGSGSM